jgi:hypothetical protein
MSVMLILKMVAAIATALTGLPALFKPESIYGFTEMKVMGARSKSEIRAIFGGMLIGAGIAPFIFGAPAYAMLGVMYACIAIARAFSIVFDKSYAQSNIISLIVEIIFAAILLIP